MILEKKIILNIDNKNAINKTEEEKFQNKVSMMFFVVKELCKSISKYFKEHMNDSFNL